MSRWAFFNCDCKNSALQRVLSHDTACGDPAYSSKAKLCSKGTAAPQSDGLDEATGQKKTAAPETACGALIRARRQRHDYLLARTPTQVCSVRRAHWARRTL